LGTEQTHVVPVKMSLPLWWQPTHHHKMPQSTVCLKILTKLRARWLKKGFVWLYLLVFVLVYLLWGLLSTLHQCSLCVESSALPDADKSNNQPWK
jgi:hypothetical protein